MDSCRKIQALFIDAFYDGLNSDQKRDFDAHIRTCPDCASTFAKLSSTLEIMGRRQRPEPETVFWTGYWDRLSARLEATEKAKQPSTAWWKRLNQTLTLQPNWVIGAAAAVGMILIGMFIGKLVFNPRDLNRQMSGSMAESSSQNGEMVALDNRTGEYLHRSKVLLLGLINFDPELEDSYTLNLPYQQEISQSLVQEAALLKDALKGSAQKQLIELITDLEVILLQIANLELGYDLSAIEMVKSGVDRRGVLLKINLEEMRRVDQTNNTSEASTRAEKTSI